jgi:hypothetical protein
MIMPETVVAIMRTYIASSTVHLTFGLLRKKSMPLTSLQSNVDNAASMLPWNVNMKMDNALARRRRKRFEERANSFSTLRSATAACMSIQSSGMADVLNDPPSLKLSWCCCRTVLRRDFWRSTTVFERWASAGFRAFHSAPSRIIAVLLNLRHIDDVSKHFATDTAVCQNDQLNSRFTLSARSNLAMRMHLNPVYISTIMMIRNAHANGPMSTKISFVWGE